MKKAFVTSLIVSTVFLMLGGSLKMQHWPGGIELLFAGMLFAVVYSVIALINVFKNEHKSFLEKMTWLVCFVLFSLITAIFYIINEFNEKSKSKS